METQMSNLQDLSQLVIVLQNNRFGALVLVALLAIVFAIAAIVHKRPPKD